MAKKVNLGSKKNREVTIYLDLSDEDNIRVMNDEEIFDADNKLKAPLPDHVFELKSEWLRSNWSLQHIIEANSYVDKVVPGGRSVQIYDPNANIRSQVKVMLKKWNLDELDPAFKLDFDKSIDDPSLMVLSKETMQRLGKIDPPSILNMLVNKMMLDEIARKNVKQTPKETPAES